MQKQQQPLNLSARSIKSRLKHIVTDLRCVDGQVWWKGNVLVNGELTKVTMTIYEMPSEWGIRGGRISKLFIGDHYHYERSLTKQTDNAWVRAMVISIATALTMGDELPNDREF